MTTALLTSSAVLAAGAFRMMARHLVDGIDPQTAHPDRLDEVAEQAEALLVDARRLAGHDHRDATVNDRINILVDAANTARKATR